MGQRRRRDDLVLAEEFKKAKDEGKKEYEAQKATIEEKGKQKKEELAVLAEQRKSGIISDEDFQERVSRI